MVYEHEEYNGNKDASEIVSRGKIAVGYFIGQTRLKFPLRIFPQTETLKPLVEQVFGLGSFENCDIYTNEDNITLDLPSVVTEELKISFDKDKISRLLILLSKI